MNSSLTINQLEKIANDHVPLILIGQRTEPSRLFDIIGIDNESGAYEATAHLIAQGFEKLLLITGPNHYQDSVLRLKGARKAIKEAGLEFDRIEKIHGFFTFESGKAAMEEHLNSGNELPDAIFAFNDLMALGAIEAMKEKDIDFRKMEIIGFDGSELARFSNLSTVQVPMRDLGYEAGSLAIRRMSDRPITPTSVNLGTSLQLRNT